MMTQAQLALILIVIALLVAFYVFNKKSLRTKS